MMRSLKRVEFSIDILKNKKFYILRYENKFSNERVSLMKLADHSDNKQTLERMI